MRFRRSALIAALVSCLLSWPALAQTPGSGKRLYANSWALVIGINRYRSSKIPQLEYAEADAQAVAKALGRLGFPKQNVRLLLGSKATRDEVIRVLEEDLNVKMGENDRLFLYFSGHGSTIQIHRKQAGFLLTYDSVVYDWPTRRRPFMKRAPARALDMRTLMARVELMAPRHKMVAVMPVSGLRCPFEGHQRGRSNVPAT
jgi:hypothetical protein